MYLVHKIDFTTHIHLRPSFFPDKIWSHLIRSGKSSGYRNFETDYAKRFKNTGFLDWKVLNPKIHTIRRDKENALKKGDGIIPVIYKGTFSEFEFAPTLEIKSIQEIEIEYDRTKDMQPIITIDGKTLKPIGFIAPYRRNEKLSINELKEARRYDNFFTDLCLNCGFDLEEDFIRFFPENYNGKIIHFTDFKYNLCNY